MRAVFYVLADEGYVHRYGTEGFPITASLLSRVVNDPSITAVWITVAFIAALFGYKIRLEGK